MDTTQIGCKDTRHNDSSFLAPTTRIRQRQEREPRVQVARVAGAGHGEGHQVRGDHAGLLHAALLAAAARPPARLQAQVRGLQGARARGEGAAGHPLLAEEAVRRTAGRLQGMCSASRF